MAVAGSVAAESQRVGVLGGTFDPVHLGHLIVAEEARVRLGLQQVLFVPARVSPLKLGQGGASAQHRQRMVALAIGDNPAFAMSSVDLERSGPSYTVDTLRAIRAGLSPGALLYFVVGADALASFARWRSPGEIISLVRIAAVTRPGHGLDWVGLESQVPGLRAVTELIDSVQIGISSSDIRERVRCGLSIRYLVPQQVEDYILRHGLYRGAGGLEPTEEGSCC